MKLMYRFSSVYENKTLRYSDSFSVYCTIFGGGAWKLFVISLEIQVNKVKRKKKKLFKIHEIIFGLVFSLASNWMDFALKRFTVAMWESATYDKKKYIYKVIVDKCLLSDS